MPDTTPTIDDVVKQQASDPETKRPKLYQVVLMNDNATPFDVVVDTLEKVFGHGPEKAHQIMMEAHQKDKAVCGIYTRDIAETKAEEAMNYAGSKPHPVPNMHVILQFSTEPAPGED